VLQWLEATQYADWIRNEIWGWPLVLTIHVFGTATVVGFAFLIGLRLLGWFRMVPYASLSRLFPVVWVAVVLQLISGFTLWITKPTQYVADLAFMLKMLLVLAGIVLTLRIGSIIRQEAPAWDTAGTVSPRGRTVVTATLLVWCGALVLGRLTAYFGPLYSG
jgi:hypothetical protein